MTTKITLTVDADTAEELRATLRELTVTPRRWTSVNDPREREEITPEQLDEAQQTIGTPFESAEPSDSAEPIKTEPSDNAEPIKTEPSDSAEPIKDASGLPHDERIHAGSKTLNADGTWRKRRGVDDVTVESIEAQLRAREGGIVPLNDDQQEQLGDNATKRDVAVQNLSPAPTTAVAEPVASQTGELPPPAATMQVLSGLMQRGEKNAAYLKELAVGAGIENITAILTDADAHARVRDQLAEEGLI